MYKFYLLFFLFLFSFSLLNAQTTDGLVAYYPMDGNAEDLSGSGFNGQIFGANTVANRFGEPGKALSFDGTNDYLEIADAPPLRLGGSYTLSFWILIEEYNNELAYSIFSKRTGIVQDGYALQIIGTDHPSLEQGELSMLVSSGGVPNIQSGEAILENNWLNVIVCFNEENSTCTMFFDGIEVNSQVIPPANDQITATLKIGVDDQSILNNFYFEGILDELRIYDRILSESEKNEIAQEVVCDDNDCSTIDVYNPETGLCEHTPVSPENCDDGNCQTEDSYDAEICECVNEPISLPDCDDEDCQTIDFYNEETCECENTLISSQDCDDNDCATVDSYNEETCECENLLVEARRNIFIPNAFSPNGDGINDKWVVYGGSCVDKINSILIYSRKGDLVYQSKEFELNEREHAWDGLVKGVKPNQATFTYVIDLVYANGDKEIKSGAIYLMQ